MAGDISDFLITYQIRYGNNIKAQAKLADDTLKGFGKTADSILSGIKLRTSAGEVATFKKVRSSKSLEATGELIKDFVNTSFFGEESSIARYTRGVFEAIHANVIARLADSGIGIKSGALLAAVIQQDVEVTATPTAIFFGVMSPSSMDFQTTGVRRKALKRSKARKRRGSLGVYSYKTPRGNVAVRGYWSFLDQGWTSRSGAIVPGREFILTSRGTLNDEDAEALDSIPKFVESEINKFKAEAARLNRG